MEISLSILTMDLNNINKGLEPFKGKLNYLHLDVMDGKFVPNSTFNHELIKVINKDYIFDTHLMIENPEKYVEIFAQAGADLITFHYEACKNNVEGVINLIKTCGKKVGISIKPKTEASEIFPYLDKVDLILVMTVEPGFGGQEFMHDCAMKIPQIKTNAPEDLIIQVDGGINNLTAKICTSLGANSLVAGSYIYGADDYKKAIAALK